MIRVYDEAGNVIETHERSARASITPTPGSDYGPKREEPSDVRKSGTRPTRKKRDAPPLFPPELKTVRIAGPFGRIVDLILERNAVLVCLNGSLRVGSKIRKERLNSRPQ